MKIRLIYECLQSEETSVLFCISMKSTLTFLIVLLRVIVNESFDLFPFIIKYLSSLIYIIVDILCTFEDGTCGWEVSTTDPDEKFKWFLANGKSLVGNEIPGPEFDHENSDKAMFLFTTGIVYEKIDMDENILTVLTSPIYNGNEYPLECFTFWYYFDVSDYSHREEKI